MPVNDISTKFYVGQDLNNTSSQDYKDITASKKMAYTDGGEFEFNGNNYF